MPYGEVDRIVIVIGLTFVSAKRPITMGGQFIGMNVAVPMDRV